MTVEERRANWLKYLDTPGTSANRFKSVWWAGGITVAELETWILELLDANRRLEAMKIALEGKI